MEKIIKKFEEISKDLNEVATKSSENLLKATLKIHQMLVDFFIVVEPLMIDMRLGQFTQLYFLNNPRRVGDTQIYFVYNKKNKIYDFVTKPEGECYENIKEMDFIKLIGKFDFYKSIWDNKEILMEKIKSSLEKATLQKEEKIKYFMEVQQKIAEFL